MIAAGVRVRLNDEADENVRGKVGTVLNVDAGSGAHVTLDGVDWQDYDYEDDETGTPCYYGYLHEFEVIEGVPTEDEQDEPLEEWEKELLSPNTDAETALDGQTKWAHQGEAIEADLSPEDIARIERNQQRDADTARIYRLIDALGDVSVEGWEFEKMSDGTVYLNVSFKQH